MINPALNVASAVLYDISAFLWFRASTRAAPELSFGWGGVMPPEHPYRDYIKRVARANTWAAVTAGLASMATCAAQVVPHSGP